MPSKLTLRAWGHWAFQYPKAVDALDVIADMLLERGVPASTIEAMFMGPLLQEAVNELRPLCDACGALGTRHFRTEGDGDFWLCDALDEGHGLDYYAGEPIPQEALRATLEHQDEPVACSCLDDHAHPVADCTLCGAGGWVWPPDPDAPK